MHLKEGFIYVKLPQRIGEQLNGNYLKSKSVWRFPRNLYAIQELYQVITDPSIKNQLMQEWRRLDHSRKRLLAFKTKDDAKGDERLRPYQRVDVKFLKQIPHAGIFNEQRTGKTPTSLVLINEQGWKKNLFVVPATLGYQWQEEIETWTDLKNVHVVTGLQKQKRGKLYKDFWNSKEMSLIISYETMTRDLDMLIFMEFDCMLLDEAHRLRSVVKGQKGRSKQCEACFKVGRRAKHRLALTGTPTVRSGDEIFGILHFLYPDRFTGYWNFAERYFEVGQDWMGKYYVGDYKREEELEEILLFMSVNRKRSEVMNWLPEKQYQIVRLEPTAKQKKAYKDVLETFEYSDEEGRKIDAPSVLAQLIRLRQITTSPRTLNIKDTGAKEKFILEWLEDNPNEQVLIFSNFTSYLSQLYDTLQYKKFKVAMITGEQSHKERKQNQDLFQDGKINILLCNIQAAGTGLTLDAGSTAIFLDKAYNPADNEQAEDRIVSTTKEKVKTSTIISLVIKDTFDEVVENILKEKKTVTDVINNAGVNGLKRLLEKS